MKYLITLLCVVCFCSCISVSAELALTPPMGWNSFDSYGVYLHEKAAYENLEAMAQKLTPHGYEYFVVDNGWFGEYVLQEGAIYPAEKHAHDVRIDEYGRFLPSKVYFPNGLAPIADRCHELGMKFGVHLMRGIPRKAYELDLPIKGTEYTARDIANTDPDENCKWCTYCYGVDMSKPGAQAWYDGLIRHIVSMGVDFIKYDDIVPYPEEIEAVAEAIRKTGESVVLSLSPGGAVNPEDLSAFQKANMLRVTHDVWDEQHYIDECFKAWRKWQGKERPGFWIDMDMIPFGQLQLMSPPGDGATGDSDIALAGRGTTRWCQLIHPQMETFITMRALAASPLMVGGDLPSLDGYSLSLITNPEMIACNQNGVMGHLVSGADGIEVWAVEESDAGGWVGVFNRTPELFDGTLTPQFLGLDSEAYSLTDVWNKCDLTFSSMFTVDPNGVVFIRYKAR